MTDKEYQLLIVGLPEAGKSSFIHAVDELLQDPPTEDALRSYGYAKDRTYLERDKGNFRAGKKLVHTERNLQEAPPELWFQDPKTLRMGKLFIPDLRGETFQDQWRDRKWTRSFRGDLKKINGALIFVRADMPASNQELLGHMAAMRSPNSQTRPPFDPRKASPQVQLVDVLQFIATKGGITLPLKTTVLISAWDTVEKPSNLQPKIPDAFLAREWSLLDQYLHANPETFETRIFGVSALGGTEAELMDGLNRLPPQERVKLVEGTTASKDLTRPLRWLLELE
jgi:hypothetical protein